MDLPPYQRPTLRLSWSVTWRRLPRVPAHGERHHRRDRRGGVAAPAHPRGGRLVRRRAGVGQRVRRRRGRSRPLARRVRQLGVVSARSSGSWRRRRSSRRGRRPTRPRSRPPTTRAPWGAAAPDLRGGLRRPPAAVVAVPGVPARLHPVCRHVVAQRRELGTRWTASAVSASSSSSRGCSPCSSSRWGGCSGECVTTTAPGGGPLTAVLARLRGRGAPRSPTWRPVRPPLDTVRASVDHLVRMGRLEARSWRSAGRARAAARVHPAGQGRLGGVRVERAVGARARGRCSWRSPSPAAEAAVAQPWTSATAPTSPAVSSDSSSSDVT